MKVANKVYVVTGAGSGLGRQLSIQLLEKGAKVAAVDINENGLKETKSLVTNSTNLSIHTLDVTNKKMIKELPEKVIAVHGQVDGLINNAGIIQPFVKVNELSEEAIERVMNINFYGAVWLTKAFLPHLLKRPVAQIVNVSSMGGFLPVPGQSIYGASKAALKLFTEGLYAELKETAVSVTIVFPGAMDTNISENSGVKIEGVDMEEQKKKYKALPADKAAAIMLKGMEKDKFKILVGSDARTMDKLYRLSPRFATNLIYKKMKELLR